MLPMIHDPKLKKEYQTLMHKGYAWGYSSEYIEMRLAEIIQADIVLKAQRNKAVAMRPLFEKWKKHKQAKC
jgi:hypothetical protein